jgi:magnesium chelatase family protein
VLDIADRLYCVSRSQGSLTFPADFMLVGAMTPCPCGYFGDPYHPCTCPPAMVSRYQHRISGPFIDRVDIFVEVPHIEYEKLADPRVGEKSDKIRARVESAREIQRKRLVGSKISCNSGMTPAEVREYCHLDESAQSLLKAAMKQLYLSARAFHRILKLARTIADMDGAEIIKSNHLAEAVQYRPRSQI